MTDSLLHLLILGIVQGLTEFLPISSSGHLVVIKHLLDEGSFSINKPLVEISLHVGTLAAVLLFYRKDVNHLVRALFHKSLTREEGAQNRRLLKWIIVGSIPTALIGLGFKDQFEELFKNPVLVGCALVVTGLFCLITRFLPTGNGNAFNLGLLRALAIGAVQGLAIIPGISRSGATIFMAICLGVNPKEAGRYSFLLSAPAVGGAALLHVKDLFAQDGAMQIPLGSLVLGILSSFIVGLLCLGILTRILKRGNFFFFGFYCVPFGLFVVYYFLK